MTVDSVLSHLIDLLLFETSDESNVYVLISVAFELLIVLLIEYATDFNID